MARNFEVPSTYYQAGDESRVSYLANQAPITEATARELMAEIRKAGGINSNNTLAQHRDRFIARCEEANARGIIAIITDSRDARRGGDLVPAGFVERDSRGRVIREGVYSHSERVPREKPTTPERRLAQGPSRTMNDGTIKPEQVDKKDVLVFGQHIQLNDNIRKYLQQKGGKIEGNKVTFPAGGEVLNIKEKVEQYVQYLNFLESFTVKTRNQFPSQKERETAASYLIQLTSEIGKASAIEDVKYLSMKYATAIFNDILSRGGILKKNANGNYEIINWKDKNKNAELSKAYAKTLNGANATSMFDVVALNSAIGADQLKFEGKIVGQKSFFLHILEKHQIMGPNGKVQEADLLKLDWEDVKTKINTKLSTTNNAQDANELTFLFDYIESGKYKQASYNKTLFTEVNIYRQDFLGEKKVIDALRKKGFTGDTINTDDKSWGDFIKEVASENAPAAILLGLLALISGHGKIGIGILGGLLAAPIAANVYNKLNGVVKGTFGLEQLEIIEWDNVVKSLKRSNYQAKYNTLQSKNNEFRTNRIDRANKSYQELPYMDNNILFNIVDDITSLQINTEISDDTGKTVNALKTELNAKGKTYKDVDLKKFVELLKQSRVKEDGDKTVLDYLSGGLELMNRPYKTIDFVNETKINANINELFRKEYDKAKGEDKQGVLDLALKVQSILKGTFEQSKATSNSYFDSIMAGITNSGKKLADLGITGFGKTKEFFNISSGIELAIVEIESTLQGTNQSFRNTLIKQLKDYQTYFSAESKIEKYRGWFDETKPEMWKTLYSVLGAAGGYTFDQLKDKESEGKIALSRSLDSEIRDLETIQLSMIQTGEPFDSQKREIGRLINQLRSIQRNLGTPRGEIVLSPRIIESQFKDTPELLESSVMREASIIKEFVGKADISREALSKLQGAAKNIDLYRSALSSTQANHTNSATRDSQNRIKNILDTSTNILNANVKIFVEGKLNERFNNYKTQKDILESIDSNSGNEGINKLKGIQRFLQTELERNTNDQGILARLRQVFIGIGIPLSEPINIELMESMGKIDTANRFSIESVRSLYSGISIVGSDISLEQMIVQYRSKVIELERTTQDKIIAIRPENIRLGDIRETIREIDTFIKLYPRNTEIRRVGEEKISALRIKYQNEQKLGNEPTILDFLGSEASDKLRNFQRNIIPSEVTIADFYIKIAEKNNNVLTHAEQSDLDKIETIIGNLFK